MAPRDKTLECQISKTEDPKWYSKFIKQTLILNLLTRESSRSLDPCLIKKKRSDFSELFGFYGSAILSIWGNYQLL